MNASHPAAWPVRLLNLVRSFHGPDPSGARRDFWLLLNLALVQKLRFNTHRTGQIDLDRIHDLAAEKSLDLVRKLDSGQWKPLERSPGELVNFISTVARNALVDELRRIGRLKPGDAVRDPDRNRAIYRQQEGPELRVERREFISHLVACTGRLKPEHRTVWLLRVLHEMPSRQIAAHPEVRLKASHVDVILGRCREQIRGCMKSRGLDASDMPAGTFAGLWSHFRSQSPQFEE